MQFADGSTVTFKVSWGRRSAVGSDVWDVAEWDTGEWDGGEDISFTEVTPRVLSVSTRRGKDRFLKRFRVGTAKLELDNIDGIWSEVDAGFSPGDFVKIEAVFTSAGDPDQFPQAIPDSTTWTDQTAGGTWTAHGSLVLDDDLPPGVPVVVGLYYGRVESSTDIVKGGIDVTRVTCVDAFAELARIQKDAAAPVGAGELSNARVDRILTNAGQGFDTSNQLGTFFVTMAATDLSTAALQELQLTLETEGGDAWIDTAGIVTVTGRDWLTTLIRSTEVQWLIGTLGVRIMDGRPVRSAELIVNDATISNAGGIAQNAQDAASKLRYGTRTTRRLDLLGNIDGNASFLATRIVANLAAARPRVRQAVVPILTRDAADLGLGVQFGDLTVTLISSINDWGMGFAGHVVGIENDMRDDQWTVTLQLDDAFVANVDGGFDFEAYRDGFALGGQP